MRRVATILGTAAVVMLATSVFAQAPNFAGKWTRDAEKTTAMAPAGAPAGGATEVSSTAKWDGAKLVITNDNGQTITYSMDGAWLVQSTTRAGRDGGAATTTAVYWKKAS